MDWEKLLEQNLPLLLAALPALKPVIKNIILQHLDEILDAAFKAIAEGAAKQVH